MAIDEAALAELLAKQAITERLHSYCRAMDRCDHSLGYTVFHGDAAADYGAMYRGTGHGFVDFALESHKALLVHSHQVANILIRIDGDRAGSETAVTMTARIAGADGAPTDLRSIGRYVDRWEKRDGEWRIAARRYLHEFDDSWPATSPAHPTEGRRDASDESYGVLA